MNFMYGYCRISTKTQSIERQERNILAAYPAVKRIYKEAATGTKLQGRKELDKLLAAVHPGDTIVFDSVSRMSRNADEGSELYERLFQKGINLVFLKEPHINTDVYKQAIQRRLALDNSTGNIAYRPPVTKHYGRSESVQHRPRQRTNTACFRAGSKRSRRSAPAHQRGYRNSTPTQ